MNTDLDQTLAFDESCAQEELIVQRKPSPDGAATARERPSPDRLTRLDLWMWLLCFLFGTLFGSQILPAIPGF